ncbi:MAG: hypothetical protein LBW85_12490 [Deltaproteobacteria bacterium]|jgi:hypothetical protein|nr:hypothetical protein [Deltaproteobacteria bacterium]
MEYIKVLETPGGVAFLNKVARSLADGWNVAVVLPDPLRTAGFLEAVRKALRAAGGPRLDVADCAGLSGCPASLEALLGTLPQADRRRRRRQPADYFRPSESDYLKLIALYGLELLSPEQALADAKELAAASEASWEGPGGGAGKEGMRFLAVLRPDFPQIPEAKGLVTFNWWGVLSQADCDQLFEEAASDSASPLSETDYWWLKAIAAGVGGDDPWIIGEVVSRRPTGIGTVRDILEAHPLAGSIPQDFEFEGRLLYPGISPAGTAPPSQARDRDLWALGLLSPNRFNLYHPALLVAGGQLLDMFVSRGQRDILFPLVDQVHGALIHILESELGAGCWEHYITDDYLRYRALREMGPLAKALKDCVKPASFPLRYVVKELAEHAERWKIIRHMAAHSQMLDYKNWTEAAELYRKASEKFFSGQETGGRANGHPNPEHGRANGHPGQDRSSPSRFDAGQRTSNAPGPQPRQGATRPHYHPGAYSPPPRDDVPSSSPFAEALAKFQLKDEPARPPAAEEPSQAGAPSEPSAAGARSEPSAAGAPAVPAAAGAPSEPSAAGAPSEPSAAGAPSEPSAAGAPSEPSSAGAPSEPSAAEAPSEPSAAGALSPRSRPAKAKAPRPRAGAIPPPPRSGAPAAASPRAASAARKRRNARF